jgi:hypothetical protein
MVLFSATLLAAIIKHARWFAERPSGFLNCYVVDHGSRYIHLPRAVFLGYRSWRLVLLVEPSPNGPTYDHAATASQRLVPVITPCLLRLEWWMLRVYL